MEEGWLRLWRKLEDSRVFNDPDPWILKIWVWCMIKARWTEGWKHGRKLNPGQFVCGSRGAAEQLNISHSRLYRGLKTLQDWGQIRLENVKHQFTVITLCNWEVYQPEDDDERNTGETPVKHRRNTAETPSLVEEGEALKEGEDGVRARPRRKAFVKPTLEEVAAYCRERGNRVDPQAWFDHYESNGWRVGASPMRDWKAAVRTWERNEGRFDRNGHGQRDLFGGIEEFVKGGPFRDP